VIYLDSSAVVKLVHAEPGTRELVAWLADHVATALVSSVLVEVEVPRALVRHAPAALVGVPGVLARLHRVEIDATIRATAAAFPDPSLRSLDAIHLATAHLLTTGSSEGLGAFVAYDQRLLAAARAVGLPVVIPGGHRRADRGREDGP
jgi:hypothetical protein